MSDKSKPKCRILIPFLPLWLVACGFMLPPCLCAQIGWQPSFERGIWTFRYWSPSKVKPVVVPFTLTKSQEHFIACNLATNRRTTGESKGAIVELSFAIPGAERLPIAIVGAAEAGMIHGCSTINHKRVEWELEYTPKQ